MNAKLYAPLRDHLADNDEHPSHLHPGGKVLHSVHLAPRSARTPHPHAAVRGGAPAQVV